MLSKAIYVAWFTLGFFYLFLWIGAYHHRINKDEQFTALSPYWCFYENTFDDEGKNLCKKGKLIVISIALLAAWNWYLSS